MNKNIEQQEWEREDENAKGFDFQQLFGKLKVLWPWMLVCGLIAGSVAVIYLYFTPSSYKIQAKILIKSDDKKASGDVGTLQSLGLLSGGSNVDNELEIIKSYSLMRKVVENLQLNVQYYRYDNFRFVELYHKNSPFQFDFLNFNKAGFKKGQVEYTILQDGHKFVLQDQLGKKYTAQIGDTLQLPLGQVILNLNHEVEYTQRKEHKMKVLLPEVLASSLSTALQAVIPNKQVSTIMLSLEQTVPAKGEDIINKLIEVYMQANVDDNNRIADSSMAFIDGRLGVVGEQLTDIEKEIQTFKQRNEISDLGEQARSMISSTSNYAKELSQQEVLLSVIESLEKYILDNSSNPRIVPASLVVQDPTLSAVVNQYNNLLMQRSRLLLGSTESNPVVINIDGQLKDLRQDLITGINSVKRGTQVALRALRSNSNQLEAQMRTVPEKERVSLDYSRQQNIRQELYLFLLQKREETAISRSSTIANSRVLDAARREGAPVKPKKKMIMTVAFLAGLLLPFGISYARNLLNTRLTSRLDIEQLSKLPIVGEIGHNNGDIVVVKPDARDVVAEQFRALRTNLQYLLPTVEDKTILVTSCMSGEGKTFISINLATVLALTGKKVILLELDLRKPKISTSLNLTQSLGFSAYAIGKISLSEAVVPSGVHDGFFILPSGPLPPNPTELLIHERTKAMFNSLATEYDYIIIDTTPNIVTDALILSEFAQATLFIVRANVTGKDQMRIPNGLYRDGKMPRMNLVVNDINQSRYGGGYYGYGNSYGYGYGAYTDIPQSSKKKNK